MNDANASSRKVASGEIAIVQGAMLEEQQIVDSLIGQPLDLL